MANRNYGRDWHLEQTATMVPPSVVKGGMAGRGLSPPGVLPLGDRVNATFV
jgi:hypothetical protein